MSWFKVACWLKLVAGLVVSGASALLVALAFLDEQLILVLLFVFVALVGFDYAWLNAVELEVV